MGNWSVNFSLIFIFFPNKGIRKVLKYNPQMAELVTDKKLDHFDPAKFAKTIQLIIRDQRWWLHLRQSSKFVPLLFFLSNWLSCFIFNTCLKKIPTGFFAQLFVYSFGNGCVDETWGLYYKTLRTCNLQKSWKLTKKFRNQFYRELVLIKLRKIIKLSFELGNFLLNLHWWYSTL